MKWFGLGSARSKTLTSKAWYTQMIQNCLVFQFKYVSYCDSIFNWTGVFFQARSWTIFYFILIDVPIK